MLNQSTPHIKEISYVEDILSSVMNEFVRQILNECHLSVRCGLCGTENIAQTMKADWNVCITVI